MTEHVCVPRTKGQPGFGGGVGSNCVLVDERVANHEKYYARTLLRGPGEKTIDAYRYDMIRGIGVNVFKAGTKSGGPFEKYATDFEKSYSILTAPEQHWYKVSAYPSYHNAAPVLDKDHLIVGHYGWFPGNQIWLPAATPLSAGKGELHVEFGLQHLIDAGVPVYVGAGRGPREEWKHWSTDEQLYALLTDPHGRVLLYTNYDILGLQSADDVLLVLGLVYAAGQLIVAGARLGVRGLIRSFASSAGGKGPLRPKLPKGIIHGEPPRVDIGRFGHPGCLFGELKVAEGEVTYHVKAIILRGEGTAEEMANMATARLAHREMIMQAAEQAQKNGQRQFKLLGKDANANFQAHANRLANEVGVPNSGKVLEGSAGFSNYEVTLDVKLVLSQQ
jgi:hypothetical protein